MTKNNFIEEIIIDSIIFLLKNTHININRKYDILSGFIEKQFLEENLNFINNFLFKASETTFDYRTHIAILRVTSRAKSLLSNWDLFYSKTYDKIKKSNKDPIKLLRSIK